MRACAPPFAGGRYRPPPAVFSVALLLAFLYLFVTREALAFGFAEVDERARALAASSYTKPESKLPRALQQLSHDQYRQIRFKPERALWSAAGTHFELMFFHQGTRYDQPVKINVVNLDGVREIRFHPDDFDYGSIEVDRNELKELGFAGFRVLYPLDTAQRKDEVAVFLGASYFRAVAQGQVYGLSSRGLAIDTALASGEEFPRFVEFWIARPAPSARELIIYALLDSPRVTGAYRFVLKPGGETIQDVRMRLYTRAGVGKLGIAPLTSMYYFGENQPPGNGDYRPEVHDSDGLSVLTGNDEWIWRPLVNPKRLLVTSFATTDPKGFGLMQRDAQFASYQDPDLNYQIRPSAWVEPKGAWGAGRVELVQIPTPDETNDNVIAYWVPDKPLAPGQPYELEYRLSWQWNSATRPPLAAAVQTRRGHGRLQKTGEDIWLRVDFADPVLPRLAPDAIVKAIVSTDANGELLETQVRRNEAVNGWRMTLRLRRRDAAKPVELRAQLQGQDDQEGNDVLSETWSYILPPD